MKPIEQTNLYKTIASGVRKEDHKELARLMGIAERSSVEAGDKYWRDAEFSSPAKALMHGWYWDSNSLLMNYWEELYDRLIDAEREAAK